MRVSRSDVSGISALSNYLDPTLPRLSCPAPISQSFGCNMKRLSVFLGAALYSLRFASALQSPPVRVSLQSSWTAPPLLAEILCVKSWGKGS